MASLAVRILSLQYITDRSVISKKNVGVRASEEEGGEADA